MATGFTTILKLALPVQGELSGTWGTVVNDNITKMIEESVAGLATINSWSNNAHTLTTANGTTSESRCAMLSLTDTGSSLSGAASVVCPAATKTYIVKNSSGQAATLKTASGTGIAVPNGKTMLLFCDGTNVVEAVDHVVTMSAGTLTITGLTTFASLKGADSTTVTGILDEDNMSSNSATKLATQQSIKAYVDSQVATSDTLPEVLANGNTTGGTDISVTTDDKVQFRDSAIFINSSADGQLDIVADTEIQIAATTVDINGAVALNGAVTGATNITLSGELDAATGDFSGTVDIDGDLDVDGVTNLDVVDIDGAVDMASTLTLAGNADFNGDLDVDGTTNLDVVDIDGAVDMASTLTVASNIVVGGTVDGRDVATDGTKLDGIEASADVTDTANVTAAGALMDSELTSIGSVKALNQGVATGDSPTFVALTLSGNADFNGDLDVDGTIEFDALSGTGSVAVTDIADEDNMSSNSATKLATQQSIKAYVDSQVGTVDTLAEILANGNTTGSTDIEVTSAQKVQFRDSAIYINSSTDGQLDIVADTEIQIAATTIDINGAINASGEIIAASLDISGNIDVDGTTNLDVVDIDGAVDMASTLTVGSHLSVTNGASSFTRTHATTNASLQILDLKATSSGDMADGFGPSIHFSASDTGATSDQVAEINVVRAGSDTAFNLELQTADATRMTIGSGGVDVTGVLTANAGVVVDNFTLDGTTLALSSGNMTLDSAGETNIDSATSGIVRFKQSGTNYGTLFHDSNNFYIKSNISDGDLIFQGNDGGSAITALTLDMSDAGTAIFNHDIKVGSGGVVNSDTFNNQANSANIIYRSGSTTVVGNNSTALVVADSGTTSFGGVVTANAGVVVDNITIDGNEIDVGSGDFTLDVAGKINLDHGSPEILLKDDGTHYASFISSNTDFVIQSIVSDKDMLFKGNDGGSTITALTLDMSDAGKAAFNVGASFTKNIEINGTNTTSGCHVQFTNAAASKVYQVGAGQAGVSNNGFVIRNVTDSTFPLVISDAGAASFAGDVTIPSNIIHAGDTNTFFGFHSSDLFRVTTGGVGRFEVSDSAVIINDSSQDMDFRVESDANTHMLFVDGGNNRVGVGTGTPSTNFVVSNSGAEGIEFIAGSTNYIQSYNRSGSAYVPFKIDASSISLAPTASSEVVINDSGVDADFRVESDGNANMLFVDGGNDHVNIGTSTDYGASLNVNKKLVVKALDGEGANDYVAAFQNLEETNSQSFGVSIAAGSTGSDIALNVVDHDAANVLLRVTGNGVTTIGGAATLDSTLTIGGDLLAESSATIDSTFHATGNNTRALANYKAHTSAGADINMVLGVFGDAQRGEISTNTNHTLRLYVNNTPSKYLEIATTGQIFTSHGMVVNEDSNDSDFRVESNNNTHMLFVDASNDSVGIGTSSPDAPLTVHSSSDPEIRFGYSSSQDHKISWDSSKVYIEADPENANGSSAIGFRIDGTERFNIAADGSLSTPTLGSNNVRFGVNAGNSIVSGGLNNTVVGDEAGTAITTGDDNVAIGYKALKSEDANGLNVAVGSQALQTLNAGANAYTTGIGYLAGGAVTTGVRNVFVGGIAGGSQTDADFNVAVGTFALTSNVLGSASTAIGHQALYAQKPVDGSGNDTAVTMYNTAVGYNAGVSVTEGVQNTLIGASAGDHLAHADFNVAVGYGALDADTQGSKSTAIGKSSLTNQNFTSATDSHNTAVGFHSGLAITTGIRNTYVGSLAGDGTTDADYNVAVGFDALSSNKLGSKSTAVGTDCLTAQKPVDGNGDDVATDMFNTAMGYHAGVSVSTGINNTIIGAHAGDAITTGGQNVALGYSALGAGIASFYNTALGYEALLSDTTGRSSVAVGRKALRTQDVTNSSLVYNTAVGQSAGQQVSTGAQNTLMGAEAGMSITTGAENVAIGVFAGSSNGSTTNGITTGSANIAIGLGAMAGDGTAVTGDNNIAIGRYAGQKFTSGQFNIAIGRSALDANTTASNNTAVGDSALTANSTGAENAAFGSNSASAVTEGQKNTALGAYALRFDTEGSQSVAVGHQALAAQNFTSATTAHNVAVGANAGVSVTTGVSNTLIGGLAGDALQDADYNVAVGFSALSTSQLGSRSTAIGHEALKFENSVDGSGNAVAADMYNTAVGFNAGNIITTGVQNTIIGGLAGDALTTGSNNVVVGAFALSADDLGSFNTALGYNTLAAMNFASATDSYNTAVGARAGQAITTGTNNTFVGSLAGDGTDDGGSNVAVGVSALSANCGSSNTAVGVSALTSSTGATNTAFGFQAGANATSANNNVFLGRDSGITGSPGGNVTTAGGILCVGDENIGAAHVQVDWTVASDARDKTDFTALDLGLDFVKDLHPVTYKWDKRSKYGDKSADGYDLNAQTPDGTHKEDWLDIGFKAQEVEALEIAAGYNKDNKTNLVSSHTDDGKQMGLQYGKFVPILVKAIQEQQALIESLTARIETLEG